MGAHVTCTERPKELVDLRHSIDEQLSCCSSGAQECGTIEAAELEWGRDAFHRSPLAAECVPPFDIIILAEVVYK